MEEGHYRKYLGILECDTIQHEETKAKVQKEYFRRVRKVLGSKLNGGNIIRAINTWAISVADTLLIGIHYLETGRVKRDGCRETRKTMTMNGALHPRADTSRLYISRKDGGRGLISAEDCITSVYFG